jgi:hypothetical protein
MFRRPRDRNLIIQSTVFQDLKLLVVLKQREKNICVYIHRRISQITFIILQEKYVFKIIKYEP